MSDRDEFQPSYSGDYFRYQNVDLSWAICDGWTTEVIANCASEMDAIRIIHALIVLHKMETLANEYP